jgi:plastocyanin
MLATVLFVSMVSACPETIGSNQNDKQNTYTVEIKNFSFIPKVLNLAKGDRVIWVNKDNIVHNIVDSNSQKILSTTLAKGAEFSYIVTDEMNYACGFHPSMTGVVHLTP